MVPKSRWPWFLALCGALLAACAAPQAAGEPVGPAASNPPYSAAASATETGTLVAASRTPTPLPGYEQAMAFNTIEGSRNPTDECTLRFQTPVDSDQGRKDIWTVIYALDYALGNSDLLRSSVGESCSWRGYMLTFVVKRNDPRVIIAQTPRNNMIEVDLGDMEKAAASMDAQCRGCTDFQKSFLIGSLAHEIVHTREGIEVHPHVLGQDVIRLLPSVGNENSVLAQLGFPVKRLNYAYTDENGKLKTDFVVSGRRVVLNISDLFCTC